MAILVILVLGVLWAAVLLPPILRSRSESGGPGGVSDFFGRLREGLGRGRSADPSLPPLQPIMGPIGGPMSGPSGAPRGAMTAPLGPVPYPGGMTPAQRRRRDVLIGLLAASALTLLMAMFSGKIPFVVLHLLADVMLGGYVYLLLKLKARNGVSRPAAQPRQRPLMPSGAPLPNVHDLTARRFPPATSPAAVDASRDAKVLALRRSATSW